MNVKGIIVEQIDWGGTSKSLTMQPDSSRGDLWVAFPNDYDEPREGPFYFQNPSYEKQFNTNVAECKARNISSDSYYEVNGLFTFKTLWYNLPTDNAGLTYYALYLPEYAVLTFLNLYDPKEPEKKYRRTVLRDDQKPRYIIYLQCSSKHGIFNFNLECEFRKDQLGFETSNYTDEYQTDIYSSPEEWQYLMSMDDKAKTQKFFTDETINIIKKKPKWERGHKIAFAGFIVALIVLLFGNNILGRLKGRSEDGKKQSLEEPIIKPKIDTQYIDKQPLKISLPEPRQTNVPSRKAQVKLKDTVAIVQSQPSNINNGTNNGIIGNNNNVTINTNKSLRLSNEYLLWIYNYTDSLRIASGTKKSLLVSTAPYSNAPLVAEQLITLFISNGYEIEGNGQLLSVAGTPNLKRFAIGPFSNKSGMQIDIGFFEQ